MENIKYCNFCNNQCLVEHYIDLESFYKCSKCNCLYDSIGLFIIPYSKFSIKLRKYTNMIDHKLLNLISCNNILPEFYIYYDSQHIPSLYKLINYNNYIKSEMIFYDKNKLVLSNITPFNFEQKLKTILTFF